MGREAICTIRWKGEAAEGMALLESAEIILRGDIRARLPRDGISRAEVEGEALRLLASGDWLDVEPARSAG